MIFVGYPLGLVKMLYILHSLFWEFNQPPRVTQVADCLGLLRRLSTTNIDLFTIGRSPSEGDRWHCQHPSAPSSSLRLTPLIARSPTALHCSFIAIPLFTKSCLKFSEPSCEPILRCERQSFDETNWAPFEARCPGNFRDPVRILCIWLVGVQGPHYVASIHSPGVVESRC